jgi:hypothetical protein
MSGCVRGRNNFTVVTDQGMTLPVTAIHGNRSGWIVNRAGLPQFTGTVNVMGQIHFGTGRVDPGNCNRITCQPCVVLFSSDFFL